MEKNLVESLVQFQDAANGKLYDDYLLDPFEQERQRLDQQEQQRLAQRTSTQEMYESTGTTGTQTEEDRTGISELRELRQEILQYRNLKKEIRDDMEEIAKQRASLVDQADKNTRLFNNQKAELEQKRQALLTEIQDQNDEITNVIKQQ